MNILFICTGNISRSYLAEALFRHEMEQNSSGAFHVASAGILDNRGMEADPVMTDYLRTLGIPPRYHSARKVDEDDIEWADRIYVMEERHRGYILGSWPDAAGRIERLGRYIAPDQAEDDIPDPYGRPAYYYRVAQSQITSAVKRLFGILNDEVEKS